MNAFKEKYGPWALVTGASSGIGEQFATQLAAKGLHVVVVARRKERLDALVQELQQQYGIEAKAIAADLTRPDFMDAIRAQTDSLEIGLLVNNAGFATTGTFLENDLQKEVELLHVNCRAPLMLTHEFGNKMVERKRGGIVFVSSTVSAAPTPYWANYSASKAYDLFLAQAISREVRTSGVEVLALCPGGTKTEFQEVAGINVTAMSADKVVAYALQRIGRTSRAIPGWYNRLMYHTSNLLPTGLKLRLYEKVMSRIKNH